MKYSLRSLMILVTLVCVVLGGAVARVEYLRRMAAYHYATRDNASYNTMMSHKQKAHEYRQSVYGPWGKKWGDLSGEEQH